MAKPTTTEQKARDQLGKLKTLRYNEPRDDLDLRTRPTELVDPRQLGLAGVRLQVESILSPGCGPGALDKLSGLGEQVTPVLIRLARKSTRCDCRNDLQSGAIAALGRFPLADVVDALQLLAADVNADLGVRAQALLSLGNIGSSSCVTTLCHALKEPSPELRKTAARGLAAGGSIDGLRSLERVADGDEVESVRLQAFRALHRLQDNLGVKLTRVMPPKQARQRREPSKGEPPLSPSTSHGTKAKMAKAKRAKKGAK